MGQSIALAMLARYGVQFLQLRGKVNHEILHVTENSLRFFFGLGFLRVHHVVTPSVLDHSEVC